MRRLAVLLPLAIAFVIAWLIAGRGAGPDVTMEWPTSAIGQSGELVLLIDAPKGRLTTLDVELTQGDNRIPVFKLGESDSSAIAATGENRFRFTHSIGKRHYPELVEGPATVTVTAGQPTLFGLQQTTTTLTRPVVVRLTPPRVAVMSTHHYINHGGSEVVVYRASPPGVPSGVRVGDREFFGFPASGAGITSPDASRPRDSGDPVSSSVHVAFFALSWDQDVNTQISVFARDDAGNEATAALEHRVFPRVIRRSRIGVDDAFLGRVVPAILQNSPDFKVENPGDLLASYLRINRDMRRMNDSVIATLAAQTSPRMLWRGPFKQLVNSAVEAGFADRRTYVYKGDSVDFQTHLGFDLASTSAAPVQAANSGVVVHAGFLGIYGNCVILDHGMGLQSLYAHLSSIGVQRGDTVQMSQELGRSGSTGLAGGDHLHFTMLLGGRPVTPIDWWSAQWIEDRITRKLREAGGG
jgi:murein DD-endopeptidase MepM/ murein hydrolase activator NlpD